MAKMPQISTKRLAIDKANTQMLAIVAVAAFISVFSLVAAHAVWQQNKYLAKVTKAKSASLSTLKQDTTAFIKLKGEYQAFDQQPTNAIGGALNGTGDNDGDNAKIILDALPASYDFPALTSSLEKIMKDRNLTLSNITGTDDQVAQQSNTSSPNPQPVPIPFSFSITNANYANVQQLINTLHSSIRPIQIDTLTISGGANNMQVTVTAHTYYQPGKNFKVTTQVIK